MLKLIVNDRPARVPAGFVVQMDEARAQDRRPRMDALPKKGHFRLREDLDFLPGEEFAVTQRLVDLPASLLQAVRVAEAAEPTAAQTLAAQRHAAAPAA